VALAGVVIAERTGTLARFAEPGQLRAWLIAQGGYGQLAFVVAYGLLQPFGVPGTVFLLVAPLLWPWPEAFALTMAGTMTASVVGFSFARFVARDWVAQRIPARFRKYEEALARRGFLTVLVLRFVFWMPQMLHAFFGISRVPFWTHFWASLLGYLIPLFLMAYYGEALFERLRALPTPMWWAIGVAAVALIAITVVVTVRRRRRRTA
jgi:uncharacterized membrane protein YdjX (TVP38/TMEM64 family)